MEAIIKKLLALGIMLLMAAIGGYLLGYSVCSNEQQPETHSETQTNVIHRDTIIYDITVKDSTVIDWHMKPIEHFDTITQHDTTFIIVPIYHYHFAEALGDVWCSGYDVTLDSLRVKMKETVITTTETVTIQKDRYKNFIGADVGFYDASLLYMRSFGRVSVGLSAGYTYDRQATARGIIGLNF